MNKLPGQSARQPVNKVRCFADVQL